MVSETISLEPGATGADQSAGVRACPVCGRESKDGLVSLASLDEELRAITSANAPAGHVIAEVCPRCLECRP